MDTEYRVPEELKGLRACMRCGLIKTANQVIPSCTTCSFLFIALISLLKKDVRTVHFFILREVIMPVKQRLLILKVILESLNLMVHG